MADQYKKAWFACSDQLHVGNPNMMLGDGTGIECAVREIKRLQAQVNLSGEVYVALREIRHKHYLDVVYGAISE